MNSSDKIENSLRLKLHEFVEQPHIHSQTTEAFYIWLDNPETIKVYKDEDDLDDELFARFLDWFIFDFKSFNNNSRIIELFTKETGNELNSEEKNVLKDWRSSIRSYYEIKDLKHGEYCRLEDIFSNKEIVVHDSIVSSNLNHTDLICARPVFTKDKNFFFSVVTIYPLVFKPLILDFFNKSISEYELEMGKQEDHTNYLKDYGYLIGKHIDDVIKHPRYLTPEGEDFVIARSAYKIKKKKEIISNISGDESFSLLNDSSDDLIIFRLDRLSDKEVDVFIEIDDKELVINCNSRNTLDEVKIYIEFLLKDLIKHKKDTLKNFDELTDNKEKHTFKLPKGVRSKKQFNSELDSYYAQWIDTPLQQLDGLSPREAILSPESRQKLESILVELELLYDDAKKAGEPYYEVSKLREELQKTMI